MDTSHLISNNKCINVAHGHISNAINTIGKGGYHTPHTRLCKCELGGLSFRRLSYCKNNVHCLGIKNIFWEFEFSELSPIVCHTPRIMHIMWVQKHFVKIWASQTFASCVFFACSKFYTTKLTYLETNATFIMSWSSSTFVIAQKLAIETDSANVAVKWSIAVNPRTIWRHYIRVEI